MRESKAARINLTQPGAYSLLLAVAWTVLVAVSLYLTLSAQRREIENIAKNVARAYIDKDILFRYWNALHGGVYVPVSPLTQPNEFLPLSTTRERDIVTPSGRRLTLVNPSYMTRQLYELSLRKNRISGRLTSLRPLRPENKPDPWERGALETFERGATETAGIVTGPDGRVLRLIKPLPTEESCLHCHAHQGYKVGDIRGGISIRLPMAPFETALRTQTAVSWGGHGGLWLLGLIGIYAGYTGLRRRTVQRDRAEQELLRANEMLENLATTDALTGISNRRKMLELLELEMGEAARYGTPLSLIFFDIDRFKAINDSLGHETGDLVLKELALLVRGVIRQTDIFGRFGGEEFLILARHDELKPAYDLAEKVRMAIEQHDFAIDETVTCSFGVTLFRDDDTPQRFIGRADEAMYEAKSRGRNRVAARL